MTSEKAKQKRPVKKMEQPEKKEKNLVVIIGAIIGGIFVIAGAVIGVFISLHDIAVVLKDAETGQRISGYIYFNNRKQGSFIYSDYTPTIVKMREGSYRIKAESENYRSREIGIGRLQSPLEITLVNKDSNIELIPIPQPLPLTGWTPWKGITVTRGKRSNECIVKSKGKLIEAAGFANASLTQTLRGKTLVLYFSNTEKSDFSEGRMAKLEYNQDILLKPTNQLLIHNEYLPAEDTPLDKGIEFLIPSDFNGRLNFVFYQANLRNLKITAFYK